MDNSDHDGKSTYTTMEREYHAAYPKTRFLWTTGALLTLVSRHSKGVILWAFVGAAFALMLWFAYMYGAGAM